MDLAGAVMSDEDLGVNVKPYLKYSVTAHVGFAIALWALATRQVSAPSEVYRIDFIGPTAGIINRDIEAGSSARTAPAGSAKTSPENRGEDFALHQRHHTALPRPSMLTGAPETKAALAPLPIPSFSDEAKKQTGAGGGEGAGASVTSDLPNFPFPWYITQLRSALWAQWSAHMPSGSLEATVMFAIMRNGQVVDLRVESSSGDQSFDFAALSAVQNSEPFPPLPGGFHDAFLKIHVRFTSQ